MDSEPITTLTKTSHSRANTSRESNKEKEYCQCQMALRLMAHSSKTNLLAQLRLRMPMGRAIRGSYIMGEKMGKDSLFPPFNDIKGSLRTT